jgi:flavodoxin
MNHEISNSGESIAKDISNENITKKTAFDWNMFENRADVLKDLRQRQEFVDLMIVSEDGGEEIVHFAVLSALKKKFANAINEAMSSSQTPEVQLQNGTVVKKVLMNSFNKEVLKIITDCAYSGFIVTNIQTVWDILQTAQLYDLKDVILAICTYLVFQLNTENCIKLFHLGLKYKHKLANASWIYLKIHFTEVCETFYQIL